MRQQTLSARLSRAKGRVRAVGWAGHPAAPPVRPGLGASALAKGPWTCRHSAERGLPSPGAPGWCPHRRPPPSNRSCSTRAWSTPAGVSGFYFGRLCCKKQLFVGVVKLQKLVCYEAADGMRPLPRACQPEVAGAGGQGQIRGPFAGHRVHRVPAELKTSPGTTPGAVEEQVREHPPQTRRAGKHLPKPLPAGTSAGRRWAVLLPEARKH